MQLRPRPITIWTELWCCFQMLRTKAVVHGNQFFGSLLLSKRGQRRRRDCEYWQQHQATNHISRLQQIDRIEHSCIRCNESLGQSIWETAGS